jgi:tryptophanyl-tRNA synthetase
MMITKAMNHKKKRVVSAMRPTGSMHLGNYHGALKNWLTLQHEYDCYFFIADLHALTTNYQDPSKVAQDSMQMLTDWLAAGLDPQHCTIFLQSQVPAHSELFLLLSMLAPLPWLERVPSYKDQQLQLRDKELNTLGFLGYPLLQSADILLYHADIVPVGEDQVAHLELVREIARRFNHFYPQAPALTEPLPLLTKVSKLSGLDGRKMSKSYQNTIDLNMDKDTVSQKILTMPTDPARQRRNDSGNPENCPVWPLHQVYSNTTTLEWVQTGCTTASIGCLDCKRQLLTNMETELTPIREKHNYYQQSPTHLQEILQAGAQVANTIANHTLQTVKQAMGLVTL